MNRVSSSLFDRALRARAAFRPAVRISLKTALCGGLAAAAIVSPALLAQTAYFSNTVTTVASGLHAPSGLAVDAAGDVFVADTQYNRVVEIVAVNGVVSSSSQINVVSGFYAPYGVAVDRLGDVFVADAYSSVKEIVAVNGVVSQNSVVNVVASGFSPQSGLAVDPAGDVFVADYGNSAVKEIVAVNGTISSLSTVRTLGSGFLSPTSVALDAAGDVFVADYGGDKVKEIVAVNGTIPSQPTIVTLGGTFYLPLGVAVDGAGNVFVADYSNWIKEIVAVGGSVSSNSPVITVDTDNSNSSFYGLALNAAGDLFVAKAYGDTVEKLHFNGSTFASAAVATPTPKVLTLNFTFTAGGTIGAPAVLTQGAPGKDFADAGTGSCTTNGTTHVYAAGDTCTVDVGFTPIAAGERYGAAVLQNSSGTTIATGYVQGMGLGPQAGFPPGTQTALPFSNLNPFAIATDASGNLYIAEGGTVGSNSVVKETWTGSGYTQSTVASGLRYPVGVAVDGAGNVFIADQDASAVLEESPLTGGGYAQTGAFTGLGNVEGVAVDGSGNVYIGSLAYNLIKETLTEGSYVQSTIATGIYPYGIAVDISGNIYLSQNSDQLFKETPSNGTYVQSVIASGFGRAYGVTMDEFGNLYVADIGNNAVIKETLSGSAYTQSTIASLTGVIGVAVDSSENIYACSDEANTAWKIDLADPPTLSFASTSFDSISSDSPKAVTLANIGNAPLTFPAPGTGNNPAISSNFSLDSSGSSACPLIGSGSPAGTLASGASCQFSITFAPVAVGALNGSLRVTDNDLNAAPPAYASQRILLSGTAVRAMPTITWATPATISYGTALSTAQLNAAASVAGTFAYSPALGAVLRAGTQTLSVTFTPTDTTDYTTATSTVILTVSQVKPTITRATPAAIPYGTALSATQLNATASVPGTFAYSPALGAVLSAGSQTLSVTFTPTNTTDYTTATSTVILTINQVKPTLMWATPAATPYGTALSATQLNATASVAGTFAYSPALGAVLKAGTQTLSVIFTPTDTTDYTTATSAAILTVSQVKPTITWATPAAIPYGTALSATQLNATASVAGTFTYSPALATVLNAGSQMLSAIFTPTDTTDYSTATSAVTLTVTPIVPALAFAPISTQPYGVAPFAVSATSPSTGAVTYSVTSGAATIAGNMVTVTGLGSVVLTASQAAAGNYAPATATTSFLVNLPFVLGATDTRASVVPGAATTFSLTLTPSETTFPDAITLSATGLPAGATAIFSPATVAGGGALTPVTLTIQTSSTSARNEQPQSRYPGAPIALGFLLLPLLGLKSVRERLRRMPRLPAVLLAAGLSLGAVLGISGCGSAAPPAPQNYTVVVAATDTLTKAQTVINLTLTVE